MRLGAILTLLPQNKMFGYGYGYGYGFCYVANYKRKELITCLVVGNWITIIPGHGGFKRYMLLGMRLGALLTLGYSFGYGYGYGYGFRLLHFDFFAKPVWFITFTLSLVQDPLLCRVTNK